MEGEACGSAYSLKQSFVQFLSVSISKFSPSCTCQTDGTYSIKSEQVFSVSLDTFNKVQLESHLYSATGFSESLHSVSFLTCNLIAM